MYDYDKFVVNKYESTSLLSSSSFPAIEYSVVDNNVPEPYLDYSEILIWKTNSTDVPDQKLSLKTVVLKKEDGEKRACMGSFGSGKLCQENIWNH